MAKNANGPRKSAADTKPTAKRDSEDDSEAEDSEVIKLNEYELRQADGDSSNDSSDDERDKYSKEYNDLGLKTNRSSPRQ